MAHAAVALEQLRNALPIDLSDRLPTSLHALREASAEWLRTHASEVELWGGHTLRGLGYVLAGTVIGALMALQLPARPVAGTNGGPLNAIIRQGFDDLVRCFCSVILAQARIAVINATLTAVFLLGVLPVVDKPLPMAGALVGLTLLAGLIPVVGNLISNSVIVLFALSSSWTAAALALLWLVAIHKLEYFLNAQIIGSRIRAQAWELLIAMLVMEALFGLAGLISAPIAYAQIKLEMHRRGWLD